jgi:LacI family transcriptional regulator
MAGGTSPFQEKAIAPLGVKMRQSSDVSGIDDADVAAAVTFIREYACQGVSMEQVVAHVVISRSQLERRFRKCLGRSPQAEIRRVQLRRVKQLLAETDLTLESIAKLTGFRHPEYLSVVFKRTTGQTPGEYRQETLIRRYPS